MAITLAVERHRRYCAITVNCLHMTPLHCAKRDTHNREHPVVILFILANPSKPHFLLCPGRENDDFLLAEKA